MSASLSKLHILLVEDDRLTRTVIRDQMRACGYTVTTAENGETALKLLRSDKGRAAVDLVVTDVRMPKITGAELIGKMKLQDTLKRIPVVVMSSNDSAEDVAQLMEAGAVEYLVKPVERSRLQSLTRHISPALAAIRGAAVDSTVVVSEAKRKVNDTQKLVTDQPVTTRVTPSPQLTGDCSGDSQDTGAHVGVHRCVSQALLDAVGSLTDGRESSGVPLDSSGLPGTTESKLAVLPCDTAVIKTQSGIEVPPSKRQCVQIRSGSQQRSVAALQVKVEDKPGFSGRQDSQGMSVSVEGSGLVPALQLYPAGMFQAASRNAHPRMMSTKGADGSAKDIHTGTVAFPMYINPNTSMVDMRWQCVAHAGSPQPMMAGTLDGGPQKSTAEARKMALERFRQKKAKRDYSKKVRYEARKKLAEQRPRFKGQFVKMPAQQAAV